MHVPNWWVVLQQFARPGLAVCVCVCARVCVCVCVCLYGRSVHCVLYTVPISHISRPGLSPEPRENQYDVSFLLTTSNFWDAKDLVTEVTSCSGVFAGKLTVAHMVSLLAFNGTRIFLFCHIYLNISFDAIYLLLPVSQVVFLLHVFPSVPYMN